MSDPDRIWKLLEKPEAWCKGELARNSAGEHCLYWSDSAASFCLLGAAYVIYGNFASPAVDKLFVAIGSHLITNYNDAPERTHAEVYQLCKELDV